MQRFLQRHRLKKYKIDQAGRITPPPTKNNGRKTNMKNKILKSIAGIQLTILLVSIACFDSDTKIFYFTATISFLYLVLFYFVNEKYFETV